MGKTGPTAQEFEHAREEMLAELSRQSSAENLAERTADAWLTMELYKLAPAAAQVGSLTLGDLQRVAARLFKDATPATIVVGDAQQAKSNFAVAIEVRSAKSEVKTATEPAIPPKKP
jgi:predicted Zn-dependent peptidase